MYPQPINFNVQTTLNCMAQTENLLLQMMTEFKEEIKIKEKEVQDLSRQKNGLKYEECSC